MIEARSEQNVTGLAGLKSGTCHLKSEEDLLEVEDFAAEAGSPRHDSAPVPPPDGGMKPPLRGTESLPAGLVSGRAISVFLSLELRHYLPVIAVVTWRF